MRVLLVTHRFPPQHTAGTERYTEALGLGLLARGYEVHVLAAEKDVTRRNTSVHRRDSQGLIVHESKAPYMYLPPPPPRMDEPLPYDYGTIARDGTPMWWRMADADEVRLADDKYAAMVAPDEPTVGDTPTPAKTKPAPAALPGVQDDPPAPVPELTEEEQKAQAAAAEAARIKATLRRERIKRALRPKSDREKGPRGHGTGFFVSADGKIVTNNHVIEKCGRVIWIDTTDGQQGTATILGTDKGNDLALLSSTLSAPAVAVFRGPVPLNTGGDVTVIGYGTIKLAPIKPHVTPGTFGKSILSGTRFEMKAAVRPGNSGGPVLDESGYVAGVVFAQLNTVKTFKKSGKLILDRGFAISNPIVFRFLERNNVDFRRAPPRSARSRDTIFREAKPFIARVSCRPR